MEVFTHGLPSYKNLEKYEKQALLSPLVDVIKDFYKDPANQKAYQEWLAKRYDTSKSA